MARTVVDARRTRGLPRRSPCRPSHSPPGSITGSCSAFSIEAGPGPPEGGPSDRAKTSLRGRGRTRRAALAPPAPPDAWRSGRWPRNRLPFSTTGSIQLRCHPRERSCRAS
jgi:hypothetical protein